MTSIYSLGFNTRIINLNKTEVISLSHASPIYDSSNWRSALVNLNIPSWHDFRSPSPVVYFSFPFCSSVQQCDSFLEKLLDAIVGFSQSEVYQLWWKPLFSINFGIFYKLWQYPPSLSSQCNQLSSILLDFWFFSELAFTLPAYLGLSDV